MGSAVIFSGTKVKTLKSTIDLNGGNDIISSTVDPTTSPTSANPGSLLLNSSTGKLYRKNDSGSSTNWTEVGASGQAGINYILNPDAANGTTGWSTYKETDSVTFQDTGDTVTLNSHGIAAGTAISFTSITSTTGISTNTLYYVVNPTTNTFQVATSVGGSALALTTNGSGTMVRSIPKTGSGGSPNISWTRNTSSPLRGAADFSFQKGSANYMGEGVAYSFTIDNADIAKTLTVTFDYQLIAGTYSTGDLTVYLIADPTGTPVIIQPAGYQIQSATASTKMRHIATFQTQASGTSYRLVIQIASVNASSYTLDFDTIAVGPQYASYGCPVTDWQSYTPTFTNLNAGTSSTSSYKWRRVGDSMEIVGRIQAGGTGMSVSGDIKVSIPSGFSIDTSKTPGNSNVGSAILLGAGVSYWPMSMGINDSTSLFFVVNASGAGSGGNVLGTTVPVASSTYWTSGSYITWCVVVAISGWSSNVVMSSDAATNVVAWRGYTTSTQTITSSFVKVTNWATLNDTNGAFDTTNSKYVVPVSGYYQIQGSLYTAVPAGATQFMTAIYKNGSVVNFGPRTIVPASSQCSATYSNTIYCNAGDYLEIYGYAFANNVVLTGGGATGDNNWSIERVSGPSQIAATDTVACVYNSAAGNNITNAATNYIDFGTKEFDLTNSVVGAGSGNNTTATSTWRFVCPVSGTYYVNATISLSSIPGSTAIDTFPLIFVSGTEKQRGTRYNFTSNAGGANLIVIISGSVRVVAGDYISIAMYQSTGATRAMDTTASSNRVSIVRVGN